MRIPILLGALLLVLGCRDKTPAPAPAPVPVIAAEAQSGIQRHTSPLRARGHTAHAAPRDVADKA